MVDSSLPADNAGESFLQDASNHSDINRSDMQEWDIAELVRDHHRAVYGYAFRLAGSQGDAEDLTQQTFMICQQKIHQVRDPEKVRSWLYSVLRNCFLKARRRRSPTPAGNLELDVETIPDETPGEDQIDRQLLQRAINDLPEEFRLVVVMFYYEECSYKEIADKLDLPIGTVMSRLSRAKGRLRQRLLNTDVAARI